MIGFFGFNLSAFVTSARSVTFLMRKEFQHVVGFEDWYTNKQKLMQSDNDFKFFNELRVATVHTQALHPKKSKSEYSRASHLNNRWCIREGHSSRQSSRRISGSGWK